MIEIDQPQGKTAKQVEPQIAIRGRRGSHYLIPAYAWMQICRPDEALQAF
jgi:hypothetical protein